MYFTVFYFLAQSIHLAESRIFWMKTDKCRRPSSLIQVDKFKDDLDQSHLNFYSWFKIPNGSKFLMMQKLDKNDEF